MDIKIVCTKTCTHRPDLEQELKDLGLVYEVLFVEEHPELIDKYAIRHSPNLIVDEEVICRDLPSEGELKRLLKLD